MTREGLNRRSFLTGGAAALGGAALALGGRAAWEDDPIPVPSPDAAGRATEAFRGTRQAGVSTRPQAFASLVALDLKDDVDYDALVRLMRIWTDDIDRLTQGRAPLADTEPELGAIPARLTVTVGYGPAVFSAAGLDHLKPSWLKPLPSFGVDKLEDQWNDGDIVLQICADDETTVAHTVRLLVKDARTFVSVRWLQRGFREAPGSVPPGTTMRNLMGQVDGTRNPDLGVDPGLVWHPDSGTEALAGSTSMVVRRIAMNLDTWDEIDRGAREQTIGRRLDTGAPLTGTKEHDVPDLEAKGADGLSVIPPFAHVRRARDDENPRQRFLRRGYNYDEAPRPGELSSSGLVFVTFQADVDEQFVPIQQRLDELDLLNTWTTPIGSAVFFVPGGARAGEYLGQRLLES